LPKIVAERLRVQLGTELARDRGTPTARVMFQLSVATPGVGDLPAIFPEQPQDVANFHVAQHRPDMVRNRHRIAARWSETEWSGM